MYCIGKLTILYCISTTLLDNNPVKHDIDNKYINTVVYAIC